MWTFLGCILTVAAIYLLAWGSAALLNWVFSEIDEEEEI